MVQTVFGAKENGPAPPRDFLCETGECSKNILSVVSITSGNVFSRDELGIREEIMIDMFSVLALSRPGSRSFNLARGKGKGGRI